MPLRPWLARTNAGMHATVRQYPILAGEVPKPGDIVHLNATKEVVRTVAADPTPLLGIACEDASADSGFKGLLFPGLILVIVFTTDAIFAMEGNRAPLATDRNVAYGIARDAAGVWTVDTADVVNTRVHVVDVDLARNLFFVKVLAAHRQSPE